MAMVRRNVLRVRPLGKRRSTGRTPQRVDEVWKKEMARNMPDGQKGVKRAIPFFRCLTCLNMLMGDLVQFRAASRR